MPLQPRPFRYPTVTHAPRPESTRAAAAVVPTGHPVDAVLGDGRWREWRAKGQRESAAFGERMRVIGIAAAVVGVAAALLLLMIGG